MHCTGGTYRHRGRLVTQRKIGHAGYRPALKLTWAQLKQSSLSGRVVYPLTKMFDRFGEGVADAFAGVGGVKKDFATQCYEVRAFPRVTLTVIYWRGGEEVSSGGQVVFDEGITEYLPIEDTVIACEELVRRLREHLS